MAESYNNGIVQVICFSETFYTICFKPEVCKIPNETDNHNTLFSICTRIERASNKALNFNYGNLDVGILAVKRDLEVKIEDFDIAEALTAIVDFISSCYAYQAGRASETPCP